MKKTNNTLQKDVKTMEQMVASLRLQLVESEQKNKSKDTLISALHHQLFLLKNAKFGRRTEKLEEDKQLDLGFDEAELLSAQAIEPEEHIETKMREPGTWIRDRVEYEVPFGVLGLIGHAIYLERDLKNMFAYRSQFLREYFSKPRS